MNICSCFKKAAQRADEKAPPIVERIADFMDRLNDYNCTEEAKKGLAHYFVEKQLRAGEKKNALTEVVESLVSAALAAEERMPDISRMFFESLADLGPGKRNCEKALIRASAEKFSRIADSKAAESVMDWIRNLKTRKKIEGYKLKQLFIEAATGVSPQEGKEWADTIVKSAEIAASFLWEGGHFSREIKKLYLTRYMDVLPQLAKMSNCGAENVSSIVSNLEKVCDTELWFLPDVFIGKGVALFEGIREANPQAAVTLFSTMNRYLVVSSKNTASVYECGLSILLPQLDTNSNKAIYLFNQIFGRAVSMPKNEDGPEGDLWVPKAAVEVIDRVFSDLARYLDNTARVKGENHDKNVGSAMKLMENVWWRFAPKEWWKSQETLSVITSAGDVFMAFPKIHTEGGRRAFAIKHGKSAIRFYGEISSSPWSNEKAIYFGGNEKKFLRGAKEFFGESSKEYGSCKLFIEEARNLCSSEVQTVAAFYKERAPKRELLKSEEENPKSRLYNGLSI